MFNRILKSSELKIPSGLYTYRGEEEFVGLALQLRVEPEGTSLLVINANTVLYLNETATAHAYFFMKGYDSDEAIMNVRKIYNVSRNVAKKYHEKILFTINTLSQTEEICPISFLDVERIEPFSIEHSAPIRMDLALTFRCQNKCLHCYTGGPRLTPELNTKQWMNIIDKLNELGIFIITLTGGEPTLREDIPDLLRYSQSKGIVTGLITNGRRLKNQEYVNTLEKTGLDFVQITLESHLSTIHDSITDVQGSWQETVEGIRKVGPTSIYLTTNTNLNKLNAANFLETIDFLYEVGVAAFGCNSLIYSGRAPKIAEDFALSIEELKNLLPKIQEKSSELGMKFMWYTPTQYCKLNPVSLGLGIKSCTASRINMCINPQGDVYPCQSYFEKLGNILKDKWEKIWNHDLSKDIRKRSDAPEECQECMDFHICGGGCPLELKENKYICAETQ